VIKPRPLPRLRVQIPFERSFTQDEFLRLKRGFLAESMEDRWHIFFKNPWLTFIRSWNGFCVYKVRLEKSGDGYRLAEVWVNRDIQQYSSNGEGEDAELLSSLINGLLSAGWERR
jgi:hypothetical protein